MGRIEQVLDTIGAGINSCLLAAGLPLPVTAKPGVSYIGWPSGAELQEILKAKAYQISIFPTGEGKKLAPIGSLYQYETITASTITGTLVGNVLTLSGTITIANNIYIMLTHPTIGVCSAYYRVQVGDSLTSVATALKNKINTCPAPLSASSSGAAITINGSVAIVTHFSGTGVTMTQTSFVEQMVQISVWASNPFQRAEVTNAFWALISNDQNLYLDLADGTSCKFTLNGAPKYIDESMYDLGLYQSHTMYAAQYRVFSLDNTYQVGILPGEIDIIPGNFSIYPIGG